MKRLIIIFLMLFLLVNLCSQDLQEIVDKGELIQLGMRFANFNTANSGGFCYEFIDLFCQELGVEHRFIESDWDRIIPELRGDKRKEPMGDLISTGMTILPWRQKLVNFSEPVFPTQVWVIASAESKMQPVKASTFENEFAQTVSQFKDQRIACIKGTSLDLLEYGIEEQGFKIISFDGSVDDIAPAIVQGKADAGLVDIADALIALHRWPGKLKIIGPINETQELAVAFRKNSPKLLARFNEFLKNKQEDGTYIELVNKYYPFIIDYYPEFFEPWQKK